MMRAIRFATQLHFDIAPKTLEGIKKFRNRFGIVSKERIIIELNKIITSPEPSIGFDLLFQYRITPYHFPGNGSPPGRRNTEWPGTQG